MEQPLAPERRFRPELVDIPALAEAELRLTPGLLSGRSRTRLVV